MKLLIIAIMALFANMAYVMDANAGAAEIAAKEAARAAYCAEQRNKDVYSVSTKCGTIGGSFGFNLPEDYSATREAEKYEKSGKAEIRWVCTQFELSDRIVHQCRVDHTNQIKVTPARTWVEYKAFMK